MITVNGENLCEACFAPADSSVCTECGYVHDENSIDKTVLEMGSVLENRYLIGKVIGKGGFGITYLAYDMKLQCRVAIKEYYPYGVAVRDVGATTVSVSSAKSKDAFKAGADKFYQEAKLVAGFNGHPNIVS
ncbi:MAG: serine/threonine protein kinase, partial [Clostridia bacterium]|nr:serine/threonine protein kinase [Clostridia bacterium]